MSQKGLTTEYKIMINVESLSSYHSLELQYLGYLHVTFWGKQTTQNSPDRSRVSYGDGHEKSGERQPTSMTRMRE